MSVLVVVAVLVVGCAATSPDFEVWAAGQNKTYVTDAELNHRYEVWAQNDAVIRAHNSRAEAFELGHNAFSDLTEDEFAARFRGLEGPMLVDIMEPQYMAGRLPPSVDWVAAGAVTPVKNQGGCGSCWDFAATAALEGAFAIEQNHLHNTTSFSEQEILDCDHKGSCKGGNPTHAWKYNQAHNGTCTEVSYPYDSHHKHHNNTCEPCTPVRSQSNPEKTAGHACATELLVCWPGSR